MRQPRGDRGEHAIVTTIFVLAALAAILTFLFQFDIIPWPRGDGENGGGNGGNGGDPCAEASLSLSRGSGPSETEVVVRGSGFPSDEDVELRFHTEALVPARTDADGAFEIGVVIPGTFDPFAPAQFDIIARAAVCTDRVTFELTE